MPDLVPDTNDAAAVSRDGDDGLRFDVFLSHKSRDKTVVERIAERLKREHLEPWLDSWCLVPGTSWQAGLADGLAASRSCAVLVGPGDLGAWANGEVAIALDRAATDPDFRLFLVLLPGLPERFDTTGLSPFLRMRTWVDYRAGIDDESAFEDLVKAVNGLPLGPDVPIDADTDVCPYRGLGVFDEGRADFFFGRDGGVQRLVEKPKPMRFLAGLGASGSGKSLLVRAGLVPALKRRGILPTIALLRPGAQPLEALYARSSSGSAPARRCRRPSTASQTIAAPITAAADGTIRLWNLRTTRRTPRDTDAAIALACRTAGRNLTGDEWKTYFPDDAGRATCDQFPLAP